VKATAGNFTLNHLDASAFRSRLKHDSLGLCYNAIVTFGSAVRDILRHCYGWAIIKGYYSCFYAMRSVLAFHGYGIAHIGSTPFEIDAKAGKQFRKRKGNTHQSVYTVYKDHFHSSSIVVESIDAEEPIVWLRKQRELINYRLQRFSAPRPPIQFDSLTQPDSQLRPILETYLANKFYAFDKDHACLALPLHCVLEARNFLKSEELFDTSERKELLGKLLKDGKGKLANLYAKLEDNLVV
jgi:hypothetical protein